MCIYIYIYRERERTDTSSGGRKTAWPSSLGRWLHDVFIENRVIAITVIAIMNSYCNSY